MGWRRALEEQRTPSSSAASFRAVDFSATGTRGSSLSFWLNRADVQERDYFPLTLSFAQLICSATCYLLLLFYCPHPFTQIGPSHLFSSPFIILHPHPIFISPSPSVLPFPFLYILHAYPPVSDKKVIRFLMASISFPLLFWKSTEYCIPEDSLCCF